MPTHAQMTSCIALERGALVFWSPEAARRRPGTRVQIVDVFSLQVATGYTRDPQGRVLLEALPSLAAGRSWSLAKAAQLIRNDARPHRWVALQQDLRAWGLFWAGGGLQHCRELLAAQAGEAETASGPMSSALVPVTPEALMRLVMDLAPRPEPLALSAGHAPPGRGGLDVAVLAGGARYHHSRVPCGNRAAGRQLELLLERTTPSSKVQ